VGEGGRRRGEGGGEVTADVKYDDGLDWTAFSESAKSPTSFIGRY